MERAKAALEPLLQRWRKSSEAIGAKLAELEGEDGIGAAGVQALMEWIHAEMGIDVCDLMVWYRIAKEDLPRDVVKTRWRRSTIAKMSNEAAEESLKAPAVYINSPTAHRRIRKAPRDFDQAESAVYMRAQGFIQAEAVEMDQPYRRYRASSIEVDDDGNCTVYIESARIQVQIPRKLMAQNLEAAGVT